MHIAVIIATTGRADLLRRVVARLARQTRRADRVILVGVTSDDLAGVDSPACAAAARQPLELVLAERGLPRQRNAGLAHLAEGAEGADGADIAVFFDDDFVPANDYLAVLEQEFAGRPELVGATARLIADGIKSPGISFEAAVSLVEAHRPQPHMAERRLPALYGCNLSVRLTATRGLRFDETLPLYGWQEDVDFSYRLGRKGLLVQTGRLTGVHLGAKGGRTSGRRLGYSQIANPVYLLQKRTIPPRLACRLMARNLAANLARSLWPEPYVDRIGRLRGNLMALGDLVRGCLHPGRILEL